MERIVQSRVFLFVLSFLSAPDLIHGAMTNLSWQECCYYDLLWKDVFFREKISAQELHQEDWIKDLMRRPLSRNAAGWTVEVESEDDSVVRRGVVREVQRNCFLVEYEDGTVNWEYEGRMKGPWHEAGKSRFNWIAGPSDGNGLPNLVENGDSGTGPPSNQHKKSPGRENGERSGLAGGQGMFPPLDKLVGSPSEGSCWRLEYKHMAVHVPEELVLQIKDNTDEVLDLVFSHSGDYLATCSRDESLSVYKVHSPSEFELLTRELCQGTPCRVLWSPNDLYLLVTIEEPQGNALDSSSLVELWELVDEDPMLTELVRHQAFPCSPFDLHACWLPDGRFIAGYDVNRTRVQGEGGDTAFDQSFAVWKPYDHRYGLSERIHLTFRNTNFAHLLQVSSDPQLPLWGIFSTGSNPFLGHQVKILPLDELCGSTHSTDDSTRVEVDKLDTFDCEGAICSLRISANDKLILVNVRPFLDDAYREFDNLDLQTATRMNCPDISNQVVLQVWHAETRTCLLRLEGHHAFTTKLCPFLIFCQQSCHGDRQDFVASGSEDSHVYVWHLRYGKLVKVLKGHTNVVSAVSWNKKYPGLLVSASDDMTVCVWGKKPKMWTS